ncbi:hypothetical protein OG512_09025 [Streptomyces sp. NBC_01378]|uniref:hypothetical protein n=1 Tax=Streptomyces sp. NBC_01378 TaxID=2903844 RepID=UPI003249BC98
MVSDHIVQFTGDADALLADPVTGLLFTGTLGMFGPCVDGVEVVAAQLDLLAAHRRQQEPGGRVGHFDVDGEFAGVGEGGHNRGEHRLSCGVLPGDRAVSPQGQPVDGEHRGGQE